MSHELTEAIALAIIAIIVLSLPAAAFFNVILPEWRRERMEKKAANRQKPRAQRRRRKKPA